MADEPRHETWLRAPAAAEQADLRCEGPPVRREAGKDDAVGRGSDAPRRHADSVGVAPGDVHLHVPAQCSGHASRTLGRPAVEGYNGTVTPPGLATRPSR